MRYSAIFHLDILSFLVHIFLYFPGLAKKKFLYLSLSGKYPRSTHVYPSLRTRKSPFPFTYDLEQNPSSKPHEENNHPYETHEVASNPMPFSDPSDRDLQSPYDLEHPLHSPKWVALNSMVKGPYATTTLTSPTSNIQEPSSSFLCPPPPTPKSSNTT